jgi:hypothetical protein
MSKRNSIDQEARDAVTDPDLLKCIMVKQDKTVVGNMRILPGLDRIVTPEEVRGRVKELNLGGLSDQVKLKKEQRKLE